MCPNLAGITRTKMKLKGLFYSVNIYAKGITLTGRTDSLEIGFKSRFGL